MGTIRAEEPALVPKAMPRDGTWAPPILSILGPPRGPLAWPLCYLHIGVEGGYPHLGNLLFHTHIDFG